MNAPLLKRFVGALDGSVVVAVLDGELTINRLHVTKTGVVLRAENPTYADI